MKLNQICNLVVEGKSAKLIRPKKDRPNQYDYKELFTGNKKGWVLFDLFTANAIRTVYNALSPKSQAKLNNMNPLQVAGICFKLLK